MKKILYTLFILPVILSSCVRDVDDVFDEPSSVRVEQAIAEYQTLLKGTENGWLMEYYPSPTQEYGGFWFVMKFGDEDQVSVSTEAFGDPSKTATSLYSLKKDIGPTLNFDTYNELFHFFSDPDDNVGAGTGKGYEGDYEFMLRSHTENEIVLRGKKTKNAIRMTRLTEPAEVYLNKVMETEAKYDISEVPGALGYSCIINEKELLIAYNKIRGMNLTYDGTTKKAASIPTDTGMKFYEPIELGGKTMQYFAWNNEEKTFHCTDAGSTDLVFNIAKDPSYLQYDELIGKYKMKYTNSGGKKLEADVEISVREKGQSFNLTGLPFPLVLKYNEVKGAFELLGQAISGTITWTSWQVEDKGYLSGDPKFGQISKWNQDKDNFVLTMVDKGNWSTAPVNGFLLWDFGEGGGEYKAWGNSRFTYISFEKIK